MKESVFALYHGDKLMGIGTKKDLGERFGMKPSTVYHLSTPAHKRKLREGHNAWVAYAMDEEGNIVRTRNVTMPVPEWMGDLPYDEQDSILKKAEKLAVDAWEDWFDTAHRVIKCREAERRNGQMDLYDYV